MRRARGDRVVVAALATAALGYGLMQSFITPLLPLLRQQYGVSEGEAAWLVTGFLLTASIATPVVGRLGDMFGRARLLRVTMVVFTIGTLLAAISMSFEVMLAARLLQGVGGALFPLAFGIIRERLPVGRIAGAIGMLSSIIAIGSGFGIVLAGPIVAMFDYHAVFVVAALVVTASTVFVFVSVPSSAVMTGGRVDWAGALLLSLWLAALLLAVTRGAEWGWMPTSALSLGTAAVFVVWMVVERRAVTPIISLRLMRSAPVLWSNVLAFLFGALLFASMVLLPAFVQAPADGGFGFSASIAESGLYLVPQTIMFFVTSLLAARMHRWPGSRASIVLGAVVTAVGTLLLVVAHDHVVNVVTSSALTGIGVGLIYSHLASLLVRIVPPGETGSATGMNTNIRNIGGAVGAQTCAALVAVGTGVDGYVAAFTLMAVIALAAIPAALILRSVARGAE